MSYVEMSWNELDRRIEKAYNKGRHDAIDELKGKKEEIIRWLIKRDKEGYGTTNGELLDHILGIAEEMKEGAWNGGY